MFAGPITRGVVINHLKKIGNAMNMEPNAYADYDDLVWGIRAKEEGGEVRFYQFPHRRYYTDLWTRSNNSFRRIPTIRNKPGLGFIILQEGDEDEGKTASSSKKKGPSRRSWGVENKQMMMVFLVSSLPPKGSVT